MLRFHEDNELLIKIAAGDNQGTLSPIYTKEIPCGGVSQYCTSEIGEIYFGGGMLRVTCSVWFGNITTDGIRLEEGAKLITNSFEIVGDNIHESMALKASRSY